jgi:hypothetical protein
MRFPSHAFVWAGIEPFRFFEHIIQKRCVKPPDLDLIRGHYALPDPMKRHLPWLALSNDDPGSTEILSRHNSAQYQTVSQVTRSGTTPSSKSPPFSPSGLLKCLRMGSMQMSHHNLTTQTEPQGYINAISIKINNTYET